MNASLPNRGPGCISGILKQAGPGLLPTTGTGVVRLGLLWPIVLIHWQQSGALRSALPFAFNAVGMAVAFACQLRLVPDKETGVAGEFVRALRNDLDDEFF